MVVKVIPYGLLELIIRRPFLEPLIEKMSQVLFQLSSSLSLSVSLSLFLSLFLLSLSLSLSVSSQGVKECSPGCTRTSCGSAVLFGVVPWQLNLVLGSLSLFFSYLSNVNKIRGFRLFLLL